MEKSPWIIQVDQCNHKDFNKRKERVSKSENKEMTDRDQREKERERENIGWCFSADFEDEGWLHEPNNAGSL